MKNLDWNIYTYRHRRAFAYCVSRLIHDPVLKQEMLKRAEVHDMDKMLMYLFLDQHTAQLLHVQRQPHHLENSLPRSYEDLVETVIDYECAPYTKQDKPLNAYDFVLLNDETMNSLMSIMKKLSIDHSGTVSEDTEGLAYIAGLGEVTEEMVLEEILTYIRNHPDNELEWVLEHAHSGIRL